MSEYKLETSALLDGYSREFNGVALRELDDLAIVSLAIPLGAEKQAGQRLEKAYGVPFPEVGKTAVTKDQKTRFLRLGQDQLFAIFTHPSADAQQAITGQLGQGFYTTDQTDVWVVLELSGENAVRALERICPIDLHQTAFLNGDVARTSMEHLGTIIVRIETERFILLSASSSAGSFLHAVETSIINTL